MVGLVLVVEEGGGDVMGRSSRWTKKRSGDVIIMMSLVSLGYCT